jgi:hypothetical protein
MPTGTQPAVVTPEFSPPASANRSSNIALEETPPKKWKVKIKVLEDCHIIVCWSQLAKLIQENMACSGCGRPITKLKQRTIGITTKIEFHCLCSMPGFAMANKSDYMVVHSENDFIHGEC